MEETKLHHCFVEALGLEPAAVTDNLAYNSVKQWDSIGHMALIAAIEKEFDVMLDTDEILALSSVRVAKDILKKRGVDLR